MKRPENSKPTIINLYSLRKIFCNELCFSPADHRESCDPHLPDPVRPGSTRSKHRGHSRRGGGFFFTEVFLFSSPSRLLRGDDDVNRFTFSDQNQRRVTAAFCLTGFLCASLLRPRPLPPVPCCHFAPASLRCVVSCHRDFLTVQKKLFLKHIKDRFC